MTDRKEVEEALGKRAGFGSDVDIERYDEGAKDSQDMGDLEKLDDNLRQRMVNVGVMPDEENRDGTIVFVNNALSHCSNKAQDGLVIMSTQKAIETYDWAKDYSWKAIDPTKDKYTAKTYLEDSDGYFIYVKPGHHLKHPVQTCMMLGQERGLQNLHNIVVVGDNASIDVVTGCTTVHGTNDALHVGVSEMYLGENSSLAFTMIHGWNAKTAVRPRTNVVMEKNSRYVSNYFILDPVGTVQTFPVAFLNGRGASCNFNTMCIAHERSDIDTGGCVMHNAPNTGSEIVSRNITYGGKMVARGRLVGNAPGAKAHLECNSIVLRDGGSTQSIPELVATVQDVDLTHEAAVGRIAEDQIEYLMSRGLAEDEAVSMIVRGFLTGNLEGLPANLKKEIDAAIEKANEGD